MTIKRELDKMELRAITMNSLSIVIGIIKEEEV